MSGQVNHFSEAIAAMQARIREAELAAARLIADAAKEKVPVDPNSETHLRDAIHVEETDDGVEVVAGDRKHWWGHIIEHGSVKMPARPFLLPALEENRARAIDLFRQALREGNR